MLLICSLTEQTHDKYPCLSCFLEGLGLDKEKVEWNTVDSEAVIYYLFSTFIAGYNPAPSTDSQCSG